MDRELEAIRDRAMDQLKHDLVKEMGLWDVVETEGWGHSGQGLRTHRWKDGIEDSPNILRKIADISQTQGK